jgi:uroporphyrinogen-III decarboxylase
LGADVFVRLLFDFDDPDAPSRGGVDFNKSAPDWQVETVCSKRGKVDVYDQTIRTPGGVLTQEFSVSRPQPGTFVHACTRKPIRTRDDLALARTYEPGMPATFPQKVKERVDTIKAMVGDDGIVGMWAPHGPFNNASLLIDTDTLYCLFLTDPTFYAELLEFALARTRRYAAAMTGVGVDVLIVSANVAGGFLGKASYDAHVLPYEQRFVAHCQESGVPVLLHNCGQIMNLVSSYKEVGARIVEPFAPPPLGDADLAAAKAEVAGQYVMIGGIDQVHVLQGGTIDQVRRTTAATMEAGKPGGKFVLQSADFLEYGTPVENVEAFVKTAIENAWY